MVPFNVRGAFKFRENLEMWLPISYVSFGVFALFKQDQASKPGGWGGLERTLTIGSPEINCTSNQLLGTVIDTFG